jgi:hypothetical protein
MGGAYYIVLDQPNPGFDVFVNGKFMAQDTKAIDRIAKKLGVRKPLDWFSMNPEDAAGMLEDEGVDAADVALPPEQWFDAGEGLQWVTALRDHIRANPKAVKNAPGVLSDLDEFANVFTQAKAIGAKWHLTIDF